MSEKSKILNRDEISKKIIRLSWEIYENNINKKELFIVGVKGRGGLLSKELCKELNKISKIKINTGTISINKDDPKNDKITSDFNIKDCENSIVILVDDVLYTGRTVRAGMEAALGFGRPSEIELMTFIDRRFSRNLPIEPNYIGKSIDTIASERVEVQWKESDKEDKVILYNTDERP